MQSNSDKSLSIGFRLAWLLTFILASIPTLGLAIASAGAGHGNYLFAKILFPLPMYIGQESQTLEGFPIILAMIQFPTLGLITCIAPSRRSLTFLILILAVIHMIFMVMTLTHQSSQFG